MSYVYTTVPYIRVEKNIEYIYTREHFLLLKRLVHLIEYFNKMSTISQKNLSFFI